MKLEKKLIQCSIFRHVNFDLPRTFDDIRETFDMVEKDHPEYSNFRMSVRNGTSRWAYVEFQADRLETDDELRLRQMEHDADFDQIEADERAELKRLKEKYEGKHMLWDLYYQARQ